MLSYFELRKGVKFILEGQPYEVLDFQQMYKAQDAVVAKTKIRNLISSRVLEKTFHQEDFFQEAEMGKIELKFVYSHREKFCFVPTQNPSQRFELTKEQINEKAKFLKLGQILTGITFQGKIINIHLPIKVHLKVAETPPGIRGDRAQGGNKTALLETGANVNVPLFIETGDIIEINTETGEYVRRIS